MLHAMKIGVSMWSYFRSWRAGELDIPGFIRAAKEAGAEGVELLDFFYKDVEADRAAALAALKETGLPCPIFSVSNNFAKTEEGAWDIALNRIKFGIDEAGHYGANVVRVFAGDLGEGITYEGAMEAIVSGLAEASKYAAEKGIKIALENHGQLAGRGDQVNEIIRSARERSGNTSLGANPDTGNFVLVNQLSHEAIKQVAPLAYMVHFKDFDFAPADWDGFAYQALDGTKYVGKAVGEGVVQLETCIQELRSAGFSGWLSVEYEGEEDPMTAVPRSIANAKKFL